jgi:hypothetical protein
MAWRALAADKCDRYAPGTKPPAVTAVRTAYWVPSSGSTNRAEHVIEEVDKDRPSPAGRRPKAE